MRVNKTVTEEEASVNVPLREETVHVERHAVQGLQRRLPTDAFQETEIDIPLRGEEVDVSKRAVVREEVTIRKDVIERDQQVYDTLRREEVHGAEALDDDTGVTDTAGADPGEGRLGRTGRQARSIAKRGRQAARYLRGRLTNPGVRLVSEAGPALRRCPRQILKRTHGSMRSDCMNWLARLTVGMHVDATDGPIGSVASVPRVDLGDPSAPAEVIVLASQANAGSWR